LIALRQDQLAADDLDPIPVGVADESSAVSSTEQSLEEAAQPSKGIVVEQTHHSKNWNDHEMSTVDCVSEDRNRGNPEQYEPRSCAERIKGISFRVHRLMGLSVAGESLVNIGMAYSEEFVSTSSQR